MIHFDLSFSDLADREEFLRAMLPGMRESGAAVALGEVTKPPRLAVFDLDATLIPCEFLDELAASRGLEHLTRGLTAAAMAGEIDFGFSYASRLKILKGTPVAEIEKQIERIPLAPGAADTIAALRAAGTHTAIITGACGRVGRAVQRRLGVDTLCATEFGERFGRLTGRFSTPLIDGDAKALLLQSLCARLGCTGRDVVAVGDGANDLKMLAAAGLSILYTSMPGAGRTPQPLDTILEHCL